jgi:hypothetical protein
MKKKNFENSFKESYLKHLNSPRVTPMSVSKIYKNSQRTSESISHKIKVYRPKHLPPLTRSKSPIVSRLQDPSLQKQYEDIIKSLRLQKAQKTSRT